MKNGDRVEDISGIENKLAELYRREVGTGEEDGIPVHRAQLANIIAVVAYEKNADAAADDLVEVSGIYPSRSVVVAMSGELSEPDMRASVVCDLTRRADRRLCGEIIRMRGADPEALIGLIMPLMLPDIPVILWFVDTVPGSFDDYGPLVDEADCVIYDSSYADDFPTYTRQVLSYCPSGSSIRNVQDMRWIALEEWRELIAGQFDPPYAVERLECVDKLRISSCGGSEDGISVEALLLSAWIHTRLGLAIENIDFQSERGVSNTPAGIDSIEIACRGLSLRLAVTQPGTIVVTRSENGKPEMLETVNIPVPTRGSLLAWALTAYRDDRLYKDVLRRIPLSLYEAKK